MVFMMIMTGWAMIINLQTYFSSSNWLLFVIGLATLILEIWMIIESLIILKETCEPEGAAVPEADRPTV